MALASKQLQKNHFDTFYVLEYGNGQFWNNLICEYALTEDQLEMIFDWVAPLFVSRWQKLSEEFMRRHADRLDWSTLSIYQKFSTDFIRENYDKVFWVAMAENQELDEKTKREFKEELDWKSKI